MIANLNSNIKTSLMSIHTFFIEVGDSGGCVLEGDPERKSWLLTHSVWKQKGGEQKKNKGKNTYTHKDIEKEENVI